MTEATIDLGLEDAKEAITAKGRERGFVTSEDVLESPASVIFQQAGNRMHAQKALLKWAFGVK